VISSRLVSFPASAFETGRAGYLCWWTWSPLSQTSWIFWGQFSFFYVFQFGDDKVFVVSQVDSITLTNMTSVFRKKRPNKALTQCRCTKSGHFNLCGSHFPAGDSRRSKDHRRI
jgi:hypothetical protein